MGLHRWKWKQKNKWYLRGGLLGFVLLFVVVSWQNLEQSGDVPEAKSMWEYMQTSLYHKVLKTHMPVLAGDSGEEQRGILDYFWDRMSRELPIQSYVGTRSTYETQVESTLTYEMLAAREGMDEYYINGELQEVVDQGADDQDGIAGNGTGVAGAASAGAGLQETPQGELTAETSGLASDFVPVLQPVVTIAREKLNDFDYLIQHFYTVDRTTTINGSQLNAQELLARDMKLTTPADQPQILIHHTHSQEGYVDSDGQSATSIVGVGDYLTRLLQEKYGFQVIHDTGEYDVIDHPNAYAYAGDAVEQILAEHPSIEVVIDLHRDGIKEGHLVTDLGGKQTAKIMFFNGLSRTTTNGELSHLANPNLADNLAFSLQMKLAAEEYYPGFTRPNYLKGYRYNLHYRPKSLLVEVGAQTNTVEEAMNAMEPLADLLHKVLAP